MHCGPYYLQCGHGRRHCRRHCGSQGGVAVQVIACPKTGLQLQCLHCGSNDASMQAVYGACGAGIAGSWSCKGESGGARWRLRRRRVVGETESPSKGIGSLRRLRSRPPKDRWRVCPAMAGSLSLSLSLSLRDAETLPQRAVHGGMETASLKRPALRARRALRGRVLRCHGIAGLQPAIPPAVPALQLQ